MGLNWNEIKSRALQFSKTWDDACNENSQAKPFWIDFFEIFGITDKRVATFELNVKKLGGAQGFVDLFWPGVLLVEHKSRGKSLDDAVDQAIGYLHNLPERDLPQLVVVCDFARFRVRILATGENLEFELKHLHKHIKLFGLLAGYKVQDIRAEDPVNIKAAERMGRLHDALKASGYSGHALEVLLVRLLFCLFADDTGIFQPAQSFRDFVEERTAPDGSDLGPRLGQLFQVLNTQESQRSKNIDEQLGQFAYINGKLFEETLPMADFSTAMREALLDACALDWSAISPAIFGSLFQSIMDDKARRNLGAHYTSEANILKLIKPLFLDELHAEFERVKGNRNKLFEFHKKLRQLTFLDPACGCGNFLVISYRELRELELKVLRASHELSAHRGQLGVDVHALIGVNVDQFFGMEIEEFPAQIAQVALWLVDHQMNLRVSVEFGLYFARIPLTSTPQIRHANALRLDWNDVLPAERYSYVLGNPPFVGAKFMDDAQREDTRLVFAGIDNSGLLDFVVAWYVKATRYIGKVTPRHTGLEPASMPRCAFVSTNSITQGEQVGVLWGWMLSQGVRIQFAHRTFSWSNEARGKAAVHCVIVGFGLQDHADKTIYEYEDIKGQPHAVPAKNINPYLVDAPDVVLPRRNTPICDVPVMQSGNKPIDDGNYLFTTEERDAFIAAEPGSAKWFRRWLGGEEFINNIERWCLWLGDCQPAEMRAMPNVMKRVQAVKNFRSSSKSLPTQKLAATPTRFHTEFIPQSHFLAMPQVSSERRNTIPIAFLQADTLCGDKLRVIEKTSLYHFGVLNSWMHMAWTRQVCGRLESRYQYSALIVYNNYPWPGFAGEPLSDKHRTAIEQAAQGVLDARAQFANSSLADLYDPLTMPPALLKAHQKLDTAVDAAYQPSGGKKTYTTDAERVAFLFQLYQRITSLLPAQAAKKTRKSKITERKFK
jgi:hypothetical protein